MSNNIKSTKTTTNNITSESTTQNQNYDNETAEEDKYDDSVLDSEKSDFRSNSQSTVKGGSVVQNQRNNQTTTCNISVKSIVPERSRQDNNTVFEVNESNSNSGSSLASPIQNEAAILDNNMNKNKVSCNSLNNSEIIKSENFDNKRLENSESKSPTQKESNKYFDLPFTKPLSECLTNEVNVHQQVIANNEEKIVDSKKTLTELKEFLNGRFGIDDILEVIKRQTENRVLQSLLSDLSSDFIETIYLEVSTVKIIIFFYI